MKNLIKLYGCVLILLFVLALPKAFAAEQLPQTGNMSLVTHYSKSCDLTEGLIKQETVSIVKHNYLQTFEENNYKYITAHVDLKYLNALSKSVLAIGSLEFNFRFNELTKQAECLSTSRGKVCNDVACAVSMFSRKINQSTEKGGGFSEVKFKFKGKEYERKTYKVFCDYMGNVSFE